MTDTIETPRRKRRKLKDEPSGGAAPEGVRLLRDGVPPAEVARRLGVTHKRAQEWWLRWVVLPENAELKAEVEHLRGEVARLGKLQPGAATGPAPGSSPARDLAIAQTAIIARAIRMAHRPLHTATAIAFLADLPEAVVVQRLRVGSSPTAAPDFRAFAKRPGGGWGLTPRGEELADAARTTSPDTETSGSPA